MKMTRLTSVASQGWFGPMSGLGVTGVSARGDRGCGVSLSTASGDVFRAEGGILRSAVSQNMPKSVTLINTTHSELWQSTLERLVY